VADFNRGNLRRFETRLEFLRENQVNRPDKLAKSLCDLAEKIADGEIQEEKGDKYFDLAIEMNEMKGNISKGAN